MSVFKEAEIELVKAFADVGDKVGVDKVSAYPIPAPTVRPIFPPAPGVKTTI